MADTRSRIRELNDQLRCQHRGGTIVVTAGIQSMGADFIAAVDVALTKVNFDSGNDPYGEHGRRANGDIDHVEQEVGHLVILFGASPDTHKSAVANMLS